MKIPLLLLFVSLAACSPTPPVLLKTPPAKRLAPVQVVRDYVPYKPVAPRDWREQNFEVSPPVRERKR
jgi:predicted small lipoprotein YifL